MTAGTAGNETRRALYGKLAGDTPLRDLLAGTITGSGSSSIYYQYAPEAADPPYVVFQKQSSTPISEGFAAGTATSQVNTEVWTIQGVDRNTTADRVDAIRRRLGILLTDGTVSISGGTAAYLRRESDIDYSELVSGVEYKHAGSLFRLTYVS